jgi:cytochrome P450
VARLRGCARPADLVEDFAVPAAARSLCKVVGVPWPGREPFHGLTTVLFDLGATTPDSGAAWARIHDRLREVVQQKRERPSDDIASSLISAGLSNDEATMATLLVFVAGYEAIISMLGLGMFALLCSPDTTDLLRRNPRRVPKAVEELLRHQTIAHIGPTRAALEDVELGGETIRAGEVVTVSLPIANRDSAVFDNPNDLDVERQSAGHLAFGYGVHGCVGEHLARLILRQSYMTLLRELVDLRLAVARQDVRMRAGSAIYGVARLPVLWG